MILWSDLRSLCGRQRAYEQQNGQNYDVLVGLVPDVGSWICRISALTGWIQPSLCQCARSVGENVYCPWTDAA
jgi:hypothetical protein